MTHIELTKEQEEYLTKHSWGFFMLPFLYTCSMQYKLSEQFGYLLLQLVSRSGLLGEGLFLIVSGLNSAKARHRAWTNGRHWKSFEHFQKVQKIWDTWGIILGVFYFLILALALVGLVLA